MFEIPQGGPSSGAPAVSREKKPFLAPPRLSVVVPGAQVRRLGAALKSATLLLVFIAIGAVIFLFGLAGTFGPWKAALRETGDPRFYLALMGFGAIYSGASLRILQVSLIGAANQDTPPDRDKGRPWTWDHPWKAEDMLPDYTGSAGGSVLGRVVFLGFIGMFNIALGSPSWLLKAVVVLLDLFALVILWDSLVQLWHWLRHSRPTISWKTFPAFLGGRLEATVRFPRPIRPSGTAVAVLRCAQDEEGTGQNRGEIKPFSLYTETREIPLPDGPLQRLDLAFDLPADLPGTTLKVREATYWQILLTIPTPGPDFETIFLAPVYRR